MQSDFVVFNREPLSITVHFNHQDDLIISKENLDISYFSGGPGGQNVNKNMNGVRLIFRIPDAYRMRAAKTSELVVRSIKERKRDQNFIHAFEQLSYKLQRYFYVKPVRKNTKISKKLKEKRFNNKKIQSLKKQGRKNIKGDL